METLACRRRHEHLRLRKRLGARTGRSHPVLQRQELAPRDIPASPHPLSRRRRTSARPRLTVEVRRGRVCLLHAPQSNTFAGQVADSRLGRVLLRCRCDLHRRSARRQALGSAQVAERRAVRRAPGNSPRQYDPGVSPSRAVAAEPPPCPVEPSPPSLQPCLRQRSTNVMPRTPGSNVMGLLPHRWRRVELDSKDSSRVRARQSKCR